PDGLVAELLRPLDLLEVLPVEPVVRDRPLRWVPEVVPDSEFHRTYVAPFMSSVEPVRWRARPVARKQTTSATSDGGTISPIASPEITASIPPVHAAACSESFVSTTPGAIT